MRASKASNQDRSFCDVDTSSASPVRSQAAGSASANSATNATTPVSYIRSLYVHTFLKSSDKREYIVQVGHGNAAENALLAQARCDEDDVSRERVELAAGQPLGHRDRLRVVIDEA